MQIKLHIPQTFIMKTATEIKNIFNLFIPFFLIYLLKSITYISYSIVTHHTYSYINNNALQKNFM